MTFHETRGLSRRGLLLGLLGAAGAGCQQGSGGAGGASSASSGTVWRRHEFWSGWLGQAIVASGPTAYVTMFGNLEALDVSSGARRWSFDPGQHGPGSAPAPVGDVVYFVNAGGDGTKVYALDARTGSRRWAFTGVRSEPLPMSPAVAGGGVYVATAGVMYGLDAATGKERWNWHRGQLPVQFAPPAVANGTVYVGNAAGVMYAFDAASGKLRWSVTCGDDFGSAAFLTRPLVAGRRLYLNSGGGRPGLYALSTADGKQVWHFQAGRGFTKGSFDQAPILAGSTLCHVSTVDGMVYGLDPATGKKRWEFATPWLSIARPLALGKGLLLAGGDRGDLFGLDPTTGAQRWRYTPRGGSLIAGPAVSGNTVCVAVGSADSAEGDLYGLRL